ncbi:hypothetical protein [Blastomonas sp. CCH8-A3]|jgi:hypothetical protein|uniref:hypothetical protein n=1 Tax=Blastomonas sp. CCH8-A3 TaxID=1768743 RepID=UPI0012E387D5|nr:hypothetical protein [Blastomonas sp. CCH8-A3]
MACIEKTYQVTAVPQLLCNLISTYLRIFDNTRSKGAACKADAYAGTVLRSCRENIQGKRSSSGNPLALRLRRNAQSAEPGA